MELVCRLRSVFVCAYGYMRVGAYAYTCMLLDVVIIRTRRMMYMYMCGRIHVHVHVHVHVAHVSHVSRTQGGMREHVQP